MRLSGAFWVTDTLRGGSHEAFWVLAASTHSKVIYVYESLDYSRDHQICESSNPVINIHFSLDSALDLLRIDYSRDHHKCES